VEIVRGPAIHWLDGRTACPLAGVGSRGAFASNRLVLDDDRTIARIEGRRIVVENRAPYPRLTLIGDFMLLGRGETADGRAVPFALHMRFDKKKTNVRSRPHLHPSTRGRLVSVELEPFELVISNGVTERVVYDPDVGREVATRPPLADWVGRALLSVTREAPRTPRALASLVVSIGVGPLRRAIVRAEAIALGSARAGDLATLLRSGEWELRVTALSSLRVLREHLGRALVLLGLDRVPAVTRLATEGLPKGSTLRFRLVDGRGSVRLGEDESEIPDAAGVARAFLELDFLGAILAQELGAALGRAPTPAENEAIVL
jgi:hypothetical protein